jgi:hypothetical protein
MDIRQIAKQTFETLAEKYGRKYTSYYFHQFLVPERYQGVEIHMSKSTFTYPVLAVRHGEVVSYITVFSTKPIGGNSYEEREYEYFEIELHADEICFSCSEKRGTTRLTKKALPNLPPEIAALFIEARNIIPLPNYLQRCMRRIRKVLT